MNAELIEFERCKKALGTVLAWIIISIRNIIKTAIPISKILFLENQILVIDAFLKELDNEEKTEEEDVVNQLIWMILDTYYSEYAFFDEMSNELNRNSIDIR